MRLYSLFGQSAAAEADFTLRSSLVALPPVVTGIGTTSKTATGITITGPSAFPANATAVEWFVSLASSPTTALTRYPRAVATSVPWPQALTGLTTNNIYTYWARYRNGTSPNFAYSPGGFNGFDFVLGTIAAPTVSGLGTSGRTATGITITGPSAFAPGANQLEWFVALAATPNTPLASHPRTTTTTAPWPQALTGLTTNQNYVYRARYRAGIAGSYVWSALTDVTFTLGSPRAATPPNVSGLGQRSKTATGITITGPSAFPANATAVEWFVALASSPASPLSSHPRTVSTSIPWPQAITGLTANNNYVYVARYRNGTSAPFAFSPTETREAFTLGTPAPPAPIIPVPVPPAPTSINVVVSRTVQGSGEMNCPAAAGATQYRWTIVSRAAGSTFTRVITTTTRRADFSGLALGMYAASVQAGNVSNVFGSSSPSSNFDIVTITVPTTPPLEAPNVLILSASWSPTGNAYTLTAAWSTVLNANQYIVAWLYDLKTDERRPVGSRRTGLTALVQRVTGNVAQLSSTQHAFVEGRVYYCYVRGVKADGDLGPTRFTIQFIQYPDLSVPASGRGRERAVRQRHG